MQDLLRKGQIDHLSIDPFMLDPTAHAHLYTFVFGFRRYFAAHFRELCFFAHHNPGNHHCQGNRMPWILILYEMLEGFLYFCVYFVAISHLAPLFGLVTFSVPYD